MQNSKVDSFERLFEQISQLKIKNIDFGSKNRRDSLKNLRINTILFAYREIFDFADDN